MSGSSNAENPRLDRIERIIEQSDLARAWRREACADNAEPGISADYIVRLTVSRTDVPDVELNVMFEGESARVRDPIVSVMIRAFEALLKSRVNKSIILATEPPTASDDPSDEE